LNETIEVLELLGEVAHSEYYLCKGTFVRKSNEYFIGERVDGEMIAKYAITERNAKNTDLHYPLPNEIRIKIPVLIMKGFKTNPQY
jgi:hypothetical protein